MGSKKFILNADDLGLSNANNQAILEGYNYGILKSASIIANGEAFKEACSVVIPNCPDLGIGIHLNITNGKAISGFLNTLTNENKIFKHSYFKIFLLSLFSKNDNLIKDIEKEFRAQIEKVLEITPITHIDSHEHIHSIPRIFELVCELAKEYNIPQVRTHFEKPYIVPDVYKHFTWTYLINILKLLWFNILSLINENTIQTYQINTNNYIIGTTYISMMDSLAISYGLMSIKEENAIIEAIIHPCRYEEGYINNNFKEFLITRNEKLKNKIENLGYEITNYVVKDNE